MVELLSYTRNPDILELIVGKNTYGYECNPYVERKFEQMLKIIHKKKGDGFRALAWLKPRVTLLFKNGKPV